MANGPWDIPGAVRLVAGGRIRTYDLWVMRRSGVVAAVAVRRQEFAVCFANLVECWVLVTRRLITAALLQPVCGPCRDHGRDQKDGCNRWGQVTVVERCHLAVTPHRCSSRCMRRQSDSDLWEALRLSD